MGKKFFPFFLFWNMIKSQPICAFYSVIVTGLLITAYYRLYLIWNHISKNKKQLKNLQNQKDVKTILTLEKMKGGALPVVLRSLSNAWGLKLLLEIKKLEIIFLIS